MAKKTIVKKKAGTATKTAKAKTAKKKTGKKKAPAKKREGLSQLDAAVQVLAKAKTPMNCGQMVEEMEKAKLWKSPAGKTPAATLYTSLLREAKKGKQSRVKKGKERGTWEITAAGKKS